MTNLTQADVDQAVRAERHRHRLVLTSAAFRGREAAALHMLSSTNLASAEIIAALAGMTPAGQPQHVHPSDAQGGQQNDFAKGREIAATLPSELRK